MLTTQPNVQPHTRTVGSTIALAASLGVLVPVLMIAFLPITLLALPLLFVAAPFVFAA